MTLWLVIASVSTLVAWYADVRGEWGLLSHENKTLLRPRLFFSSKKSGYRILLLTNFVLRAAWTLTISPFILNSTGVYSALYVLMISYLEILRRGLWNVLRV